MCNLFVSVFASFVFISSFLILFLFDFWRQLLLRNGHQLIWIDLKLIFLFHSLFSFSFLFFIFFLNIIKLFLIVLENHVNIWNGSPCKFKILLRNIVVQTIILGRNIIIFDAINTLILISLIWLFIFRSRIEILRVFR